MWQLGVLEKEEAGKSDFEELLSLWWGMKPGAEGGAGAGSYKLSVTTTSEHVCPHLQNGIIRMLQKIVRTKSQGWQSIQPRIGSQKC